MSRRKNREPRASLEPRLMRHAAPARDLISLTPRSALVASALSTASVLGASGFGLGMGAAAASVAAVFAAVGGKVHGRTVGEWITLRGNKNVLP